VVAISRNEWSASIGIGGRDQSEMVVGISRNMQSNRTKSCIQDVVYSFLFFKLIFSIDAEMVKSK
jgi:hypothetical protein